MPKINKMLKLAGISTALVTPLDDKLAVDLDAVQGLVVRQAEAGTTAVAVSAGCGEYIALTQHERQQVAMAAIQAAGGRIQVLAGVLAATTDEAVAEVRAIVSSTEGTIDGFLVLTPYYIRPSADGLRHHFEAIAAASSLPIVLYNNPGRTGINLSQDDLLHLAEVENIVGIKECDRDLGRVAEKIAAVGQRLVFLGGDDDLAVQIWSIGAQGSIMSSANLVPEWCVALYQAASAGDRPAVLARFARLLRLMRLYRGPDHPGPLKELHGLLGWRVGQARPPAWPLPQQALQQALQELSALGLAPASVA